LEITPLLPLKRASKGGTKGTGGKPYLMVEPVKCKNFFSLKTKRKEKRKSFLLRERLAVIGWDCLKD
jgi:hypothetical protein